MNDVRKYKITVTGCDDETVVYMELSDREHKLIDRLADMTYDSSAYSCMPVMEIEETD